MQSNENSTEEAIPLTKENLAEIVRVLNAPRVSVDYSGIQKRYKEIVAYCDDWQNRTPDGLSLRLTQSNDCLFAIKTSLLEEDDIAPEQARELNLLKRQFELLREQIQNKADRDGFKSLDSYSEREDISLEATPQYKHLREVLNLTEESKTVFSHYSPFYNPFTEPNNFLLYSSAWPPSELPGGLKEEWNKGLYNAPLLRSSIDKQTLNQLLDTLYLYGYKDLPIGKEEILNADEEYITLPGYMASPFVLTHICEYGIFVLWTADESLTGSKFLTKSSVFVAYQPTDALLEDALWQAISDRVYDGTLQEFLDYHFERTLVSSRYFFTHLKDFTKRQFSLEDTSNIKTVKQITAWIKTKKAELDELEEKENQLERLLELLPIIEDLAHTQHFYDKERNFKKDVSEDTDYFNKPENHRSHKQLLDKELTALFRKHTDSKLLARDVNFVIIKALQPLSSLYDVLAEKYRVHARQIEEICKKAGIDKDDLSKQYGKLGNEFDRLYDNAEFLGLLISVIRGWTGIIGQNLNASAPEQYQEHKLMIDQITRGNVSDNVNGKADLSSILAESRQIDDNKHLTTPMSSLVIDSEGNQDKAALLIKTSSKKSFDQIIEIHDLLSETIRDIAFCAERNRNGEKVNAALYLLRLSRRRSIGKIASKVYEYINSAKANDVSDSSDTTNGIDNKDLLIQTALMNFRVMVDKLEIDLFDSKAIERHFLDHIKSLNYDGQELHYLHSLNDFKNSFESNSFESYLDIHAIRDWADKYDEGFLIIFFHEAHEIKQALENIVEVITRTIKRSNHAKQILQSDEPVEDKPQPQLNIEDEQFIVIFRKAMRNLATIDHDEWLEINRIQYKLIDDLEKTITTNPDPAIGKARIKRNLRECLNEQPHAETLCKSYQKSLEERGLDAYSSNLEYVREAYYEIENAIGGMVELLIEYFPDSLEKAISSTYQVHNIVDLFDRFSSRSSPLHREIAHKRKMLSMEKKASSKEQDKAMSSNQGVTPKNWHFDPVQYIKGLIRFFDEKLNAGQSTLTIRDIELERFPEMSRREVEQVLYLAEQRDYVKIVSEGVYELKKEKLPFILDKPVDLREVDLSKIAEYVNDGYKAAIEKLDNKRVMYEDTIAKYSQSEREYKLKEHRDVALRFYRRNNNISYVEQGPADVISNILTSARMGNYFIYSPDCSFFNDEHFTAEKKLQDLLISAFDRWQTVELLNQMIDEWQHTTAQSKSPEVSQEPPSSTPQPDQQSPRPTIPTAESAPQLEQQAPSQGNQGAVVESTPSARIEEDSDQQLGFEGYIKQEYRGRLLPYLIKKYTNTLPRVYMPMLYALVRLDILDKNVFKRQSDLHRALKITFGSIGALNSFNTALHNYDPEGRNPANVPIIDSHCYQIESYLKAK